MTKQTDETMTEDKPAVDRTGYTATEQGFGENVQTTWSVKRDADGTGLGAYSTQDEIDDVITRDRAFLAERAEMRKSEG